MLNIIPQFKSTTPVNFLSFIYLPKMNARPTGFEPATSPVTGECSNQLSYDRNVFIIHNIL